jgi:ribose transport system substrate-binding protein
MRVGAKLLFIISLAAILAGCNGDKTAEASGTADTGNSGEKPLVFFSQANSRDPWRQVFDRETQAAADQHKAHFNYQMSTADADSSKQISDIENALVKKPKVLLVSPDTEAVKSAIDKAHDDGVFVVLLDRSVPGDKWDAYVSGDNNAIGYQAGMYMGEKLKGMGTVLMIQGKAAATPTTDRAAGFMNAMAKFPEIKVIKGDNCNYEREPAMTFMENFLQRNQPFDAVYAHNDEMAIGAYKAMQAAKTPKKIIVGIDACQKEVIDMIKDGKINATFSYPDPGPKGIEIAVNALNGQKPKSKKITLSTERVTKENADAYLAAHPGLAK